MHFSRLQYKFFKGLSGTFKCSTTGWASLSDKVVMKPLLEFSVFRTYDYSFPPFNTCISILPMYLRCCFSEFP